MSEPHFLNLELVWNLEHSLYECVYSFSKDPKLSHSMTRGLTHETHGSCIIIVSSAGLATSSMPSGSTPNSVPTCIATRLVLRRLVCVVAPIVLANEKTHHLPWFHNCPFTIAMVGLPWFRVVTSGSTSSPSDIHLHGSLAANLVLISKKGRLQWSRTNLCPFSQHHSLELLQVFIPSVCIWINSPRISPTSWASLVSWMP